VRTIVEVLMSLTQGTEFAGYTIVRKIGAGGMGEVYLAQHPRLPRRDEIKVLSEHFTDDAMFRARFVREAELAARLDHPSIVNVYDRGESDGRLWIAMQYVPGTDAAALVERSPNGLGVENVASVADAIGGALDHAHRHGLLHRDVKPANILVSSVDDEPAERRIRLADFGIARQNDVGSALTSANAVIGSYPYSSPEQLSGEALDRRSDVYSLACTVYELLAGTPPFMARSPAVFIHHHLNERPPPITDRRPDLDPAIDDAVQHGLAKNPADRPATAGAFAAEFRAACAVRTASTARVPVPDTLRIRAAAPAPTRPPQPHPGHQPRTTRSAGFRPAPPPVTPPPPSYESTMRASFDRHTPHYDDPTIRHATPHVVAPPTGFQPDASAATKALACGILAIPLSVVAGIGVPVGVLGLHLAGRSRRLSGGLPPAARLAQTLNLLAIIIGVACVAFAIGYALTLH